jgi:ribonuclease T1
LALVCIAINAADARAPAAPESPGGVISTAELPAQAQVVLRAIKMGGPFPYAKDGSVFSNRERRLPRKPYGYYREYTVPTPGAKDRGPRRIIAGGNQEFYYTDDHYRRFKRIAE